MDAIAETTGVRDGGTVAGYEAFRRGEPGIYSDIPADGYHRLRGISSTALKRLYCDSPRHALAVLNNPELIGSDEIDIGGAAHAIILTPQEFDENYVCAGPCCATVKTGRCPNSGKVYSEGQWYCGTHGKGRENEIETTILALDQWRRVSGIRDAVWGNATARRLLECATHKELTVLWKEEGLLCKARFDILCADMGILPDLKTCRSVNPEFFSSQAWKMGYHLQLAHYLHGGRAAGIDADLPTIIAVENDEPFDVVVFEPTYELMDRGMKARDAAIRTLIECETTGIWPGYAVNNRVVQLGIPSWAK